jgi:hypothetical protein
VNLVITKAMLSPGEELTAWTPEMVDSAISYPEPGVDPPGPYNPDDGSRGPFIQTP